MHQNSKYNDPQIGFQVEIGKENQEAEEETLPYQVIEVASPGIFLFQPNSFPYLFPAFPFPFESRLSFVDFY